MKIKVCFFLCVILFLFCERSDAHLDLRGLPNENVWAGFSIGYMLGCYSGNNSYSKGFFFRTHIGGYYNFYQTSVGLIWGLDKTPIFQLTVGGWFPYFFPYIYGGFGITRLTNPDFTLDCGLSFFGLFYADYKLIFPSTKIDDTQYMKSVGVNIIPVYATTNGRF